MYNQEQKQRFIDSYTDSDSMKHACIVVFNACEKWETKWGDDLCTMGAENLQQMFDSVAGIREKSRALQIAILRAYARWCLENGIENAGDGMLSVDKTGVGKIKTCMVKSPLHLQTYLDAIFDPESEKTVDNAYRCYYWLAFSGMEEEDIIRVRSSDVDLSELLVHFNDEEYPIYREALRSIKNCINLNQFAIKHAHYESMIDRVPGDLLVRGVRNQPTALQFRIVLSKCSKKIQDEAKRTNQTALKLSYYRIWLSGVFYRTYEGELAGIKPDFTAIVKKTMEGRTYKVDSGRNSIGSVERKLKKQYLSDYENWKLTLRS